MLWHLNFLLLRVHHKLNMSCFLCVVCLWGAARSLYRGIYSGFPFGGRNGKRTAYANLHLLRLGMYRHAFHDAPIHSVFQTLLGSHSLFNRSRPMNRKIIQAISVFLFGLLPIPAIARCNDPLCEDLQDILDAAITDFREYRANKAADPDASIEGTKVPCQASVWVNNVPMYICHAQVPFAETQTWYARTFQALSTLNPTWHFQITSPGDDRYVDAGPPDCEVPPRNGPYIG